MTTPTASLRPTLPGEAYASPAVHVRERERIFARSWLCVARADVVEEPGRPYVTEVAGESVLVVRDRGGTLRGHLNVCRHRGSRVCPDGVSGPVGHLRCPYHGWTYDLQGHLVAAPNMKDMPDLAKERHGLRAVAVTTWAGYLWVCLDASAPPLSAQVDPQLTTRLGSPEVLDAYGLGDLAVGHTEVYDVAANWKSLVENFTECYHCPTIHPELTAALPEFSSGYGSISGGRWHGAALADTFEAFAVSGKAARPPLPRLPDAARRLFFGVVVLPNVFLILVPDHVAFFRVEPLAADRTRVICDWLFEPGAAGQGVGDAVRLLDVTNRQDWEACERCQRNAGSRGFSDGGVLVPSEHPIVDFYHYLTKALGD
ncbi:MAG: aromatic ring-hydroxylating oxygenase subunit alpha [Acidimicrobiales bacterium]